MMKNGEEWLPLGLTFLHHERHSFVDSSELHGIYPKAEPRAGEMGGDGEGSTALDDDRPWEIHLAITYPIRFDVVNHQIY